MRFSSICRLVYSSSTTRKTGENSGRKGHTGEMLTLDSMSKRQYSAASGALELRTKKPESMATATKKSECVFHIRDSTEATGECPHA